MPFVDAHNFEHDLADIFISGSHSDDGSKIDLIAELGFKVFHTREVAVEDLIALCDGNVRAALRATLAANSFLAAEVERLTKAVSFRFMRGRALPAPRASERVDYWREILSGDDS
jgi:hypothetical protein